MSTHCKYLQGLQGFYRVFKVHRTGFYMVQEKPYQIKAGDSFEFSWESLLKVSFPVDLLENPVKLHLQLNYRV